MVSVAEEAWFNAPDLRRVMALLNADGGEARVAGGAVRNSLMSLPIADVDIATDLLPEAVIERAKAAGVKAVPTGIEHGTVTLVVDGRAFEVTTLRRDVETDGRHAQVAFGGDWQEDASRRDFTINGLYADKTGEVIDLVGGIADVESRTLRFIGTADERIAEDYLRILRYFRFFAWYGSGRPDAPALKAITRAKDNLKRLSAERVWSELKKLLSAADPGRALLWMRTTGVLATVLPETEKWGIDAIPGLVEAEQVFGWKPDPLIRLCAMVPPDTARLQAMAERLRFSKQETAFLLDWAAAPQMREKIAATAFARLLYRQGSRGVTTRLKLAIAAARSNSANEPAQLGEVGRLQALLDQAQKWQKPPFPLTGSDVLAAGVTAGPKVGELLGRLEEQWIESNFAIDRDALVSRLEDMIRTP